MLLSILVPVYNRENSLKRCLTSLLSQDITDYEIIITDDGSTDRSPAIIDEFAASHPGRIRTVRQENGGVAAARNAGLEAAAGEYVTWVDSDDWLKKNILGKLAESAIRHDADILLFDADQVERSGKKTAYPATEPSAGHMHHGRLTPAEYLLTRHCPWNKWVRRALFDRGGTLRFPTGEIYEDFSLFPVLALRTGSIYYESLNAYNYYRSHASIMRGTGWKKSMDSIFSAAGRVCGILSGKYPEETEFLIWLHLLLNGGLRFFGCGRVGRAAAVADIMRETYPGWAKNRYVARSRRNARLVSRMLYKKQYGRLRAYLAAKEFAAGIME